MANIIFDFDGTLGDTLPLVVRLFDAMNLRGPVTIAEIEYFRGLTLRQVLSKVGIPLWKVPSLLVKGRTDLGRVIQDAQLFKGLGETLEQLHRSGHKLYVVSSNSTSNIEDFLVRHDIKEYFGPRVYGGASVFGKYKNIKAIIKANKLALPDTYYVGDETRDVEAARKSGIHSVSVTWGFNSEIPIAVVKPEFIVRKPADLLEVFK